jgi:hypothetical protein
MNKQVKTSELSGAALDWAVCVAEYGYGSDYKTNRYSTDWAFGGPIIDREGLCIGRISAAYWIASPNAESNKDNAGPTPLIAAMRCYAASKLGDIVEIPEDLTT